MANGREFGRLMNRVLPYLLEEEMQRKQVQRWLEKQLIEYLAWGQQQQQLQKSGYNYDVLSQILKAVIGGTKGLARPGLEATTRARGLGIPLPQGIRELSPEEITRTLTPYGETMTGLTKGLEPEALPYSEEIITAATRLLGPKATSEWIDRREKGISERKKAELREREAKAQEETTKLGWAELGERKKGEEKKPDVEKRLNSLREKRWNAIINLSKLGDKMDEDVIFSEDKQIKTLRSKILSMNNDIKGLKKKLGDDPDKRHAAAAKQIKQQGYSRKDLFENEQLKSWIEENELSVWVLLEYF